MECHSFLCFHPFDVSSSCVSNSSHKTKARERERQRTKVLSTKCAMMSKLHVKHALNSWTDLQWCCTHYLLTLILPLRKASLTSMCLLNSYTLWYLFWGAFGFIHRRSFGTLDDPHVLTFLLFPTLSLNLGGSNGRVPFPRYKLTPLSWATSIHPALSSLTTSSRPLSFTLSHKCPSS